MKKAYDYCERCLKPIEIKHGDKNYTFALCIDCAKELMKKIYGEEKDSEDK